ncbi:hypothetical protein F5Y05DRAFT_369914 [Hypoxylon sp. FL0543]|nr:hypothetical protein F5Y05DRAFT_369914 [Hypoxylon sp. FL0543]
MYVCICMRTLAWFGACTYIDRALTASSTAWPPAPSRASSCTAYTLLGNGAWRGLARATGARGANAMLMRCDSEGLVSAQDQ